MQTLVLIDCNYLCWRSFFSTGSLRHEGTATGVIYGFLRDVATLQDRFVTNDLVFCFDHGKGLREKEFPFYKSKRRDQNLSEEEVRSYNTLKDQIQLLKKDILPNLGLKNIFYAKGYEADDVIAKLAGDYVAPEDRDLIIVSADKDLYQLLQPGVMMYDPRKQRMTTVAMFRKQYGIEPHEWPIVKAIGGCTSDSIPGIKGVGEKTALKYVRGELKGTAKEKRITHHEALIEQNIKLVKLPYADCPDFDLEEPIAVSARDWNKVMDRFGLASLKGKVKRERGLFDGE